MSNGPSVHFEVPPSKWFVARNLHHVEEFDLHFSLKNGQGEVRISDLVLDKEGQLRTEVFGEHCRFKRDIEDNLSDAFCVLIATVLYRMRKDARYITNPCVIETKPRPEEPASSGSRSGRKRRR
jgi:hypothetical protein